MPEIIHVIEGFAEGGINNFLKNLIIATPQFKHSIFYGTRKNEDIYDDFKTQYPLKTKFEHWKYAQRSMRVCLDTLALMQLFIFLKKNKKHKPIIHLHSSKAGFLGRVACRFLGIKKVIYTPHGASFLMYKQSFKKNMLQWLEKIGNLFGGKIICVSQSEQRTFEELNIDANYIYNGIIPKTHPIKIPHNEEVIVVNVARIVYQKNPQLFNDIAEQFIKNKNIKFIWIGDGPLRHLLVSPNITITGWLGTQKINEAFDKADIFLSTSRYEGFSISILEAMQHRLPLIISDCIGNEDMVIHYFNGALYKSKYEATQVIKRLINNHSLRIKWGNESYDICKKSFNINSMVAEYLKIYYAVEAL